MHGNASNIIANNKNISVIFHDSINSIGKASMLLVPSYYYYCRFGVKRARDSDLPQNYLSGNVFLPQKISFAP